MKNDRKIKHHLSEDLLMRYSNGTLCEAFHLQLLPIFQCVMIAELH